MSVPTIKLNLWEKSIAYSAQQTLREQIDNAFDRCAKRHNGQEPNGRKQVIDLLVKDESLCRFCLQPVVFGYDGEDDKFYLSHKCGDGLRLSRSYFPQDLAEHITELSFSQKVCGLTSKSCGLGFVEYYPEDNDKLKVRFVKNLLDIPFITMMYDVVSCISEYPSPLFTHYTIYPQSEGWVCKYDVLYYEWISFTKKMVFISDVRMGQSVYWPKTIHNTFLSGLSKKFTLSFEKDFGKLFDHLEGIPLEYIPF